MRRTVILLQDANGSDKYALVDPVPIPPVASTMGSVTARLGPTAPADGGGRSGAPRAAAVEAARRARCPCQTSRRSTIERPELEKFARKRCWAPTAGWRSPARARPASGSGGRRQVDDGALSRARRVRSDALLRRHHRARLRPRAHGCRGAADARGEALGADAASTAPSEMVPGAISGALAGQRRLLVLDDVWTEEQLAAFESLTAVGAARPARDDAQRRAGGEARPGGEGGSAQRGGGVALPRRVQGRRGEDRGGEGRRAVARRQVQRQPGDAEAGGGQLPRQGPEGRAGPP